MVSILKDLYKEIKRQNQKKKNWKKKKSEELVIDKLLQLDEEIPDDIAMKLAIHSMRLSPI